MCSSQLHEAVAARTKAEQGVRLAMVVVHRADEMLGHVGTHAESSVRDLGAVVCRGGVGRRIDTPSRNDIDDSVRWEEDSVFPGEPLRCHPWGLCRPPAWPHV